MEPTRAPWASTPSSQLPPVARGETTTAPWARKGPAALPARSLAEVSIPTTAPQFPTPIDPSTHTFIPPRKRITSIELLRAFLTSSTASDFLSFALACNNAVKGLSLSSSTTSTPPSPAIAGILTIIDTLDTWVTEIPPADHTLRYGNPSFRVWFQRLKEQAPALLSSFLAVVATATTTTANSISKKKHSAIVQELTPYFIDSFGNETRIDYGTGHETNFIAFIYCLAKLGVLKPCDAADIVLRVFHHYILFMRRIQTTYWLEPAGSHGVWGLDDYQFFPFIWGSAQFIDHPYLKPMAIHSEEVLKTESSEYLYLAAVRFVRHVKKGPLAETSPMLNDISAVPSWSKVNKGMVKMYQVEVLGKLPIMQHFLFGSLLVFPTPAPSP